MGLYATSSGQFWSTACDGTTGNMSLYHVARTADGCNKGNSLPVTHCTVVMILSTIVKYEQRTVCERHQDKFSLGLLVMNHRTYYNINTVLLILCVYFLLYTCTSYVAQGREEKKRGAIGLRLPNVLTRSQQQQHKLLLLSCQKQQRRATQAQDEYSKFVA